jgi:uncharacterized membrane protein
MDNAIKNINAWFLKYPYSFFQNAGRKTYRLSQHTAFWIAIHAVLFLAIFTITTGLYYDAPTPGVIEKIVAENILNGQIPYIDFECEYPPVALLLFLIPGLFFKTLPAYYIAFTVEMLLFDILAIFLISYLSKRINISKVKALIVYTLLMAFTAGPIVTQRYDLAAAVMVLAAVAAFIGGKNKTAWGVLALGVMAKIFPIVVAPFFAIWLIMKKQYSQLVKGIAVFGGVLIATVIPWLIMDPKGLWTMFAYHLDRGLHAESTYGSFVILGQHFGWTSVDYDFSFGSFNITSGLADNLANNSFYIMAAVLLVTYGLFAYQLHRKAKKTIGQASSQMETETLLIRFATIAVLAFLLFNKVFSAQYMVWVCPLIPLLNIRYQNLIVALLLIAGVFTIYIYPFNYIELQYYESLPVLLMANRNIIMIIVFVIIALGLKPYQKKPEPE